VLFAIGVLLLLFVASSHYVWLLLTAIYWSFVYVQLGTLGHDAGHTQISRKPWKNTLLGYLMGNLTIGVSREWWVNKHNEHHANPNLIDLDPDIDFPILIFDPVQLAGKGRLQRMIIRYQAYFFFPILSLVAISMRTHSLLTLLTKPAKHRTLELLTLAIYYISYTALVFYSLPIGQAVLFIVVHQAIFGIYIGCIFAPNHKGMPVLPADHQLGFLHLQVLTARNVTGHPITDFLYGGLNYQVEHHLFPSAPRNKLRKIHQMTKAFCHERGIPFYETSLFRSYVELTQHLHEVSGVLRQQTEITVAGPLSDPSQG